MTPFLLLVPLLAMAVLAEEAPPEARVAGGSLRGKWIASRPSGRTVAAFEGIPYAEPPVGTLRLKAPVAKKPWTGVLAADQPGSMCTQKRLLSADQVDGTEDCLFVNVYVPKQSEPRSLPVMLWVHGGGYQNGDGFMYGPEYITDRDVIFVNFNYRVGTLGFLSTGDDVIPGNHGLKDMVLVLHWVRDNIRAFGGDPDSITIFGESAGGSSVQHLMISPQTKGLFHRVIQMSGSALSPWAFDEPARARAKTDRVAAALDCPTHSSEALRDCLITKAAEDVILADGVLEQWASHPMVLFRPTAEPSGPDAFLDKYPAQVYADGGAHDVPLMLGVTSNEGCIIVVPIAESEALVKDFDQRFNELASILFFSDHLSASLNDRVYTQLRKAYFGEKAIGNETTAELLDLFTDGFFAHSTFESAKLQARTAKSPVFLYEMGRRGERTVAQVFGTSKTIYGVCHADDLQYVFPATAFFPAPPSEADMTFSSTMLDLFTTFAITGAPTSDGSWPRVQDLADKTEYAFIERPGPVAVRRGFHNERMARWSKLPFNPALALRTHAKDEL